MKDQAKTKQVLIQELSLLRQKIVKLEQSESDRENLTGVLKDREAELTSIYENVPLFMFLVDKEWTIRKTNAYTAQRVGRAVGDIINLRCGKALHCIHSLDAPEGCGFGPSCGECTLRLSAINTIETGQCHHELEARMSLSDGEKKREAIFLLSAARLTFKKQPMALVSMQDITERKQSEENLQQKERLLQDVIDGSTSPVSIKDVDGRFITINVSLERMLGKSREEIKGKTDYDIAPRELADYWRTHDKEVMETGKAILIAEMADLPDGHHIFLANKFPLVDADGQVYGVGAISHDITDRKHAEEALRESETKFRRLHESMRESFVIVDMNGRIQESNHAYRFMLGYSEEELSHLSYLDITPEKWHVFEKSIVEEQILAHGYSKVYEKEYQRKDGLVFPVELRTVLVRDDAGNPAGMWAIVRDITERKRAEETLEERRQQLKDANRELESFSYSVSHDLRAPLRAIDGFSRMILKKQGAKFDEDTLNKFNVIRRNTETMGQLIDGLLELSRLGRQAMSMSIIDMDNLIREVWEAIEVINPGRKMSLAVKSSPQGFGDRQFIRQVYSNLLANAVKFTKNRDVAQIETGGFIDDRKGNVYYVKDNGAGFDMTYYDKLFGVFQRLHTSEEFEGTGIGLATIQRIINKHSGCVWAEGKVDEGATFYFSLPASQTEEIKKLA